MSTGRVGATIVATLMLTAGMSLVAAQEATAAPLSSGCELLNDPHFHGLFAGGSILVPTDFNTNETVTVSAEAPSVGSPTLVFLRVGATMVSNGAYPGTIHYTFPFDVSTTLDFGVDRGGATLTVSCRTIESPTPAATDQTPPAWLQSYARADKDEKCRAGWNPSYAMWPHDETGGWVCDRNLSYNSSTGAWGAS